MTAHFKSFPVHIFHLCNNNSAAFSIILLEEKRHHGLRPTWIKKVTKLEQDEKRKLNR